MSLIASEPLAPLPTEQIREARLEALLRSVACGESQALVDVQTVASALLFGIANRILRNRADAEEVVGDVLLRIWTSAVRFDRTLGTAVAWLVVLCKNAAIDKLRSRSLSERCPGGFADVYTCSPLTPETLAREAQEMAGLLEELRKLSPLRQELITLGFYREFSHTEISRITGIPVGTVKSHIRRALQALRCALQSDPECVAITGPDAECDSGDARYPRSNSLSSQMNRRSANRHLPRAARPSPTAIPHLSASNGANAAAHPAA